MQLPHEAIILDLLHGACAPIQGDETNSLGICQDACEISGSSCCTMWLQAKMKLRRKLEIHFGFHLFQPNNHCLELHFEDDHGSDSLYQPLPKMPAGWSMLRLQAKIKPSHVSVWRIGKGTSTSKLRRIHVLCCRVWNQIKISYLL